MVEVGGDIEGEAVHGHPAFHVDSYRSYLILGYPNAGFSVSSDTGNAEAFEGDNQDFFQLPEVFAQVRAVSSEVHDGVADDLARAMVGDVSAAVGVEELDAMVGEFRFRDQDVIEIPGAAEGDDGWVFEEQKGIGDLAGDAAVPEVGLEVEGVLIVKEAQIQELEHSLTCGDLSRYD